MTPTPKAKAKILKVMNEFKAQHLHSGTKFGPLVTARGQAIAIGIHEAKKAKNLAGRKQP